MTAHTNSNTDPKTNSWGDHSTSNDKQSKNYLVFWIAGIFLVAFGLFIPRLLSVNAWDSEEQVPKIARPNGKIEEPGISAEGILVGRSTLDSISGPILLEHYPKSLEKIPRFDVRPGESAQLHFERDNPWYEGFANQQVLSTFNCGSFAVGPMIGLHPSDFVDAVSKPPFPNPMQVILKDFFFEVAGADCSPSRSVAESLDVMIRNNEIRKNDVVCFFSGNSKGEFVHTARIARIGPELLLLSKMGRRGPIMLTNLKFLFRHYPQTSHIKVYRFRPGKAPVEST